MTADRKRAPKKREVRITHEKTTLFVDLGDGPALLSDGFGGWEAVERPKDEPLTRWVGQPGLRMLLPLMVDGYGSGRGVERDLDKILALGRKKDGQKPPPVFRVKGAVPFSGARWVMGSTPEMGDADYEDGHLARQFLTLALLSYERPDTVKYKHKRRGHGGQDDRYTVKAGETLRSIAAKLKPDASPQERQEYAREIGKLNDVADIRRELNKGRELRLP